MLRPQGEDFLELIENENGRDQVVVLGPQLEVSAMQVFPEELVVPCAGSVDPLYLQLGSQGLARLFDQRRSALADLESYVHREQVIPAKQREESRPQER